MRGIPYLAAAVLALAGCAFSQEKQAAEAAVAHFHALLDAGRFHDIYADTADDFRRITSEAEFMRILQVVHDRLGAVRRTSEGDWRVNFRNGTSFVELHYATDFAAGHGEEEFIYRIAAGNARLAGYHVTSPALQGPAASGSAAEGKPGEAPPLPPRPAPAGPTGDKVAPPPAPVVTAPPEPSGGK